MAATDAKIVGRERELERLCELVDGVPRRGGSLVVRGEAGIGKSTLLAAMAARAEAAGVRILSTAGVHSEAQIPFAGLHQLLAPLLGELGELPEPSRAALESAFGRREAIAAPDLFVIALAALDLLGARNEPRLVVVDDAQWLDRPTIDVVAFVARRLASDPLAMLVAVRSGPGDPLEDSGLPELLVEPLDDDAAREVIRARGADLASDVRERLLREARGNPLALVELPGALARRGPRRMSLPEQLPLTARLERAFAARLDELPPATRMLLLAAAADGTARFAEALAVAGALTGERVDASAIDPAAVAGLAAIDGAAVVFRHSLVRSAVYQAASPGQRLGVHAAFAEVLAGDAERAVWHRAAAALEPDERIASELERTAGAASRRGALEIAASALQQAAELSEDSATRDRRMLLAAERAFELGRPALAAQLLTRAEPLDLPDLERARRIRVRELVDPRHFTSARGRVLLDAAAAAIAAPDADLAFELLWLASSRSWWQDPGPGTRDAVAAAVARLPPALRDDRRAAGVLAYAAPVEHGRTVVERLSRQGPGDDPESFWMSGAAAIVTGAWDLAPDFVAEAVGRLRAEGRLGRLPRVLVFQALVAARMANWTVAIPAAEEARALGEETRQRVWVAGAQSVAALAYAIRGEEQRSDALAAAADRGATEVGASFVLASVQLARGAAALGGGRYEVAVDGLMRLFDERDPAGHFAMRWWSIGDLAEAAARCGRGDSVVPLVAELERACTRTPAFWLHAGLRHAQAVLAGEDEAEERFERALAADLRRWPFERARLLRAQGEWLRRRRRVSESRGPLRAARDTFDAIGARQWGERARQELRATGETSRSRTPDTVDQLTPQELQIAQMAASGLTNREIGRRLYLSHRTVSSHLYRTFPKLGIASRSQLGGALAAR